MDVITWGKTRSIVTDETEALAGVAGVAGVADADNINIKTVTETETETDTNDNTPSSTPTDNKIMKDTYIELEYDYNYLEICKQENLYGVLNECIVKNTNTNTDKEEHDTSYKNNIFCIDI